MILDRGRAVWNLLLCILVGFACAEPVAAEVLKTDAYSLDVQQVVSGLDEPWAIAFLSPRKVLITERGGQLLLIDGNDLRPVSGLPAVFAEGQGGLLDIAIARDHATSKEVFLTYAEPRQDEAGTTLAVARFDAETASLRDLRVIFRQNTTSTSEIHFGGRVVEASDGTLFLTIGERGAGALAQALDAHNGKVIRVSRDGSVPADNPRAEGQLPEIWSLGHRNPQGATLDGAGRLWVVEHGAMGGDEINRPEAGKNYGWPVISYGLNYDGNTIGIGTSAPGLEQPAHYWDPSIAPSGMMIYSGKLFPDWQGDFFVGSLKFDMISRLERRGDDLIEVERLFQDRFLRIRDIREAPDGSIWFLSVGDGAAYRATPAK